MLIAEFSHKGEEIEIENELWQYDYGQRLQIKGLDLPETFEVHFAWKDSEKAKVVIGSTVAGISTVDIPNIALEQRRTITAYIYLSDTTEGETVNTIVLSVNKRKAPENFETPEDVDLFHHTLAATAEYQRQAKESEKQAAARSADAEAWAHGREDHPDQEQDNAKYYAEQAAASQRAAELSRQMVSDSVTQAQNDIGEAQQQAIKTITEQQGISIQKIKNQTAESEDNLKNTIRAAEQIKTDLDTEVENATPIKQGLDDSNTAAIKTKVDLDKSNTIADQIKAELEVLNTTASKTKTNLDGANKTATDLTGTLENEISEGIQTKIDIQTTGEKAMSNLQAEATKQQEFIKTSIDDTLSISGKAADAAVTGKKIDSLKEDLSNKITKFYASNQGETHITDSDNGKIQDMMIYGKSLQNGTPTPENPVEIKSVVNPTVKVCGKNLWNPTLGGYISGSDGSIKAAPKKSMAATDFIKTSGKDITVIARNFSSAMKNAYAYRIGLYNAEKKWIKNIILSDGNKYSINTFNITGTEYIRVSAPSGIYDTIQIEKGSEATSYEPYTEQSVQLPYTLNAIPVTSGGNVTIDGQQYIADYVDAERGKLVKMVDSSKLDNTQSIVDKTEWLLAEQQETDLTTEQAQALKALATYYPVTNISVNSEQLDGYTVFNYPISMANGWNYVKKQLNDNRDYIYDMDTQAAEAYVNSEYAVALTELEV